MALEQLPLNWETRTPTRATKRVTSPLEHTGDKRVDTPEYPPPKPEPEHQNMATPRPSKPAAEPAWQFLPSAQLDEKQTEAAMNAEGDEPAKVSDSSLPDTLEPRDYVLPSAPQTPQRDTTSPEGVPQSAAPVSPSVADSEAETVIDGRNGANTEALPTTSPEYEGLALFSRRFVPASRSIRNRRRAPADASTRKRTRALYSMMNSSLGTGMGTIRWVQRLPAHCIKAHWGLWNTFQGLHVYCNISG